MTQPTLDLERAARTARLGAGCITLFALPFLLVGVSAAVELVRGLAGRNPSGMPPGFAAVFALGFGGAGIGMIAAGRYGVARATRAAENLSSRPDQPWLWREDWAHNRALSPQRAGATAFAMFAFLWCVISAPVLFIVPGEVAKGNTAAWFGMLFPMVGVGLIIGAARMAIRSRKYRGTAVEFAGVPIVPGKPFAGTLLARFDAGPPERLELALSCIRRRVTGSGRNRNVSEHVLWQDERSIESHDIGIEFGEARVPFSFDIPAQAPPTTPGDGRDRVLWRLDARAATPGVDYAESFELPVFRPDEPAGTNTATTDFDEIAHRLTRADVDSPATPPAKPTIVIRPADPVGTEFISRPGRERPSVLPLFVFLVVLWGAVVFMLRVDAPLLFPLVFGAFGLLLVVLAIDLALRTVHTVVTGDGVSVRDRALGIGRTRHVALDEVTDVVVKVGMSRGQSATQAAKAWHDVAILRTEGRPIPVARYIGSRTEAEWVAAELRHAIGSG
jgi:hypothetical protein